MKNKRKSREAFWEPSYWQSYSDMMAALLLIFVLIIAITLSIYKKKTTDLEQARLELNTAQAQLDQASVDLEKSRMEIELSNKELAASLAELKEAYAKAALTEEELNKAYLEIEDAQNEQYGGNDAGDGIARLPQLIQEDHGYEVDHESNIHNDFFPPGQLFAL